MKIDVDYLTRNPYSRPGTPLASRVKALAVHWTGNPGTGARQNRDYFESLKAQRPGESGSRFASAHYICGLRGEIIQCIPETETAYHAGAKEYTPQARSRLGAAPNECTLGVELCHPTETGEFTQETLAAAVQLCADICARYGLNPRADILRHYDITYKVCPRWFVDNPAAFENFLRQVSLAMGGEGAGK